MAKQVKEERLAIVLELTREDRTAPVEVRCRADYEVKSEDLVVKRHFSPELTTAQEKAVKSFGANVLAQIKAIEEA